MRHVSHTDGYCGNGLGFVPLMHKIPLFRRYPISLMKIVLIVGIDKHYLLQRHPASLGDTLAHLCFGRLLREFRKAISGLQDVAHLDAKLLCFLHNMQEECGRREVGLGGLSLHQYFLAKH